MPRLSIIIPTHKRPATLRECLNHIEKQTVKDELEVIVISDGRDSATDAVFKKISWTFPLHYFSIEKSQQGVCRNRGVEKATAPLTLFIGDDIFLAPYACEKHLETHEKLRNAKCEMRTGELSSQFDLQSSHFRVVVLGFTTWDPAVGITRAMRWLERSGWQFGYGKIAMYAHGFLPRDIQHWFTYTSHVSLPTETAKAFPFRPASGLYGWEDIVWGRQLAAAGVRLFYEPNAKALHHHKMTLEDSLQRMKTLGQSAKLTEQTHPHLPLLPKGPKHAAYRVFSLLPSLRGRHCKAFLEGVKE